MTTIVEKKGELGFVFGFLVVVLGLAAWRGAEGAPILAGAAAVGAIVCLAVLVNWYRKPAPFLTISPDEIWYGRLDQPGMRLERSGGRLYFREGSRQSGWFLLQADMPDKPGILMTGFDMPEVAAACTAHGWTFEEDDPPATATTATATQKQPAATPAAVPRLSLGTTVCPSCGRTAEVQRIVYGFITDALIAKAAREGFALGGDIVGSDSPRAQCSLCHARLVEHPGGGYAPQRLSILSYDHADLMGARVPSRLEGAIWGHLVGNAIGVPYEFRDPAAIGDVRWGELGTHDRPAGTWSDDGALMLALLDSLLESGFDTEDQARRALAWFRGGAYTPDGIVFDIGGTTRTALEAVEAGAPPEDAGPTDDDACGNGSLMRILPLGLVERFDDNPTLVNHAHRASRVTHGNVRPQVACAMYAALARDLAFGGEPLEALDRAKRDLRLYYQFRSADHVAALDHLLTYPDRGGRGRVWDSFWSAWNAFAGASSYAETIERAVRYGNDTDTTAAIAGGLAGLRWGIDAIPAAWLAGMRGREVVEPLVARLAASRGWNEPVS
jgi:ADP-ribosyl-[dinitrogen reductase] hydrolase